jgi:hypothetical protein
MEMLTRSQSYRLLIYNYNASVVPSRLEHFFKKKIDNCFQNATRGVVTRNGSLRLAPECPSMAFAMTKLYGEPLWLSGKVVKMRK